MSSANPSSFWDECDFFSINPKLWFVAYSQVCVRRKRFYISKQVRPDCLPSREVATVSTTAICPLSDLLWDHIFYVWLSVS